MRYVFAFLVALPTVALADDCQLAAQYRELAARAVITSADIDRFMTDYQAVNDTPSVLTGTYRYKMPGTAMVANLDERIAYMQRTARDRATALCPGN